MQGHAPQAVVSTVNSLPRFIPANIYGHLDTIISRYTCSYMYSLLFKFNLPETDFDLPATGLDLPEGGAFPPGSSRLAQAFMTSSVWRKY